MEISSEMANG